MKTKGVRLFDIKGGKCIPLSEILENITDRESLFWKLLWLDVIAQKNEGKYVVELQNKINQSENGFLLNFDSIVEISKIIFQEIDLTIIASKNMKDLRRYEDDQEMYETCDIVIEMIDGGLWEIFSKDIKWIEELATKFEKIEFLTSSFHG